MKKKKLLFFTDCFIYGGCEVVLANLVNSVKITESYDVIYCYRGFKEYNDILNTKVDKHIMAPLSLWSNDTFFYKARLKKRTIGSYLFKGMLWLFDYSKIYFIYNFVILFFFLRKNKPDILFINNGGYPGSKICRSMPIIAKAAGIDRIIFNINNMAYPPVSILDRKYDKIIEKHVDIFITASVAAANRLYHARGFSLKKMINVPNTVKELNTQDSMIIRNEFQISEGTKIIGSVGLITKRKGFDVLIKSIYEVKKRNPYLKFVLFIFGDGEEKDRILALINKLKLEENVLLPGHRNNVINYIGAFDFFVLPSVSNEDMPYVIIEAMMLKKAVIGTNVAGIPEEITDGETGFVVEPNDHIQLASRIEILLKDENLNHNFGKNGYQKYLNIFSYDIVINKYLSIFNTISLKN